MGGSHLLHPCNEKENWGNTANGMARVMLQTWDISTGSVALALSIASSARVNISHHCSCWQEA